jgi:hypothetical protein
VEVVHFVNAGPAGHRAADGVHVDAFGCGLEKHAPGGLQQPVRGAEHDRGDDQGGDAVGAVEAGEQDDGAGDGGGDEGGEVGEDVLEGTLDVHRLAVGLGEGVGRGQVDGDADERDGSTAPPATSGGSISRRMPS